ncbi:hypothetical protein CRYUN_Cryun17cG0117800 [Craigia yunnanensis]
MLFAATDTTAVTLEWTMSNLLNHSHVLEKARAELDTQIGQEQLVEETDLSKLHYLQNIISETLRLYPAAPLLVPRMASDYCTIGGYEIPAETIVLVNAWAIQRDPELWEDSTSFKPERFEGKESETHKLMPFGLGRRACPGMGLAHRVLGVALGSLIQCFEWERVSEREIDMTEGKGLTMPKVEPLEAMCKARHITNKMCLKLIHTNWFLINHDIVAKDKNDLGGNHSQFPFPKILMSPYEKVHCPEKIARKQASNTTVGD